jgi:Quinohemoprotein amine dehydrogenase A, alpha subunit, haem binding
MRNRWLTTLLASIAVIIFVTACSSGASNTTPTAASSLDGATLVQERCSVCHPVARIESRRYTATDWKTIVEIMISRGAQLTPEEAAVVVNYLASNFGQ